MSSYWEKLVDLYVDGECSNEERLAVEERARVDRSVWRAIQEAKELRVWLREIPSKPPKEFETRLRDAICNSSVWDEKFPPQARKYPAINASRASFVFSSASRRVLNPVEIGIVASLLVCAVVGWAFLNLAKYKSSDRASSDRVPLASTEQTSKNAETLATNSEPWKLIPSPEGNAPDSASKAESQENYWGVARVDDKEQARKFQRILQARCAELGVSFSKCGDGQYRLKDVSKEQWLQIADDWKDADFERSNALARWEEETQENQTIRVEFKTSTK